MLLVKDCSASDGLGRKGVQVGVCSGMENSNLIWLAPGCAIVGLPVSPQLVKKRK